MGTITAGTGLISGINSKDIIDQLMSLEQRPKTLLQSRKDTLTAQQTAYGEIGKRVTDLTTSARTLQRAATFTATTATSSDDDVLSATTTAGAAVGSYQFAVARLVTSQQSVSAGYADAASTVKAGNITIEMGGGNLGTETPLALLNGGAGVRRGLFRITDRSGKSAVVDTTGTVTLDDVIKKINTTLDVTVRAQAKGDRIVLTDGTGAAAGNLTVTDLADGHAAADLGLVGSVAADTLSGGDINGLGAGTPLSALNDGRGVRTKAGGPDLVITAKDGSKRNITLGGAKSVGDLIDTINAAGGAKFKASVVPGSNGLRIVDTSGGGGALTVADATGSKAATDLGLTKAASGATLDGDTVLAGLNTVLVKSLKGGAGLTLGTISITNRSGAQQDVDLSGAKTVADVLDTINSASGLNVTASLNPAGNGIQIADASGGTGNLVIGESGGGTTAADLGVAGTFDTNTPAARGANLQLAWLSEATPLAQLNGGKGVTPGAFKITNSAGGQRTISLADGNAKTLGDVITRINAAGAGVTASINANGDGLLLTDTAAGAGKMKVENSSGTTARDLNILGEATAAAGPIDGSFEKTIAVTATDTLTTVAEKIRTLGYGASASVINDGSGVAPYRLSLTAFNSGRNGRVTFDAGTTGLDARTLVEAQDAAVFVGGVGAAQPLLVTSGTNQIAGVIPGVNIELNGVGTQPVTLNVGRDPQKVVDEVQKFVDTFNEITGAISELTKYDTAKQKGGLLLGESAAQRTETELYLSVQGVVVGAGRYRVLADVGVTIGNGAKLEFDADKFKAAIATDPEAVKNLFTQVASGLTPSTALTSLNSGRGVRVAGAGKPDFKVALRDGTTFNVTVPADGTVNDLVTAISTGSAGKATLAVNDTGKGLKVVDSTAGGGAFAIATLNGSAAAADLGIGGAWPTGTASGADVFANRALQTGGGFGYLIERRLNLLVDPVDGILTREKNEIDTKNRAFDRRMSDLDDMLKTKRARLERQFANMESVLAGLQSQQSALGSLSAVQAG